MKRSPPLVVLMMMLAASSEAWGGCEKDIDCKGDRICVKAACVSPSEARSAEPRQELELATPPLRIARPSTLSFDLGAFAVDLLSRYTGLAVEYERVATGHVAWNMSLTATGNFDGSHVLDVSGLHLNPLGGVRYYFFSEDANGFWLGGSLGVQLFTGYLPSSYAVMTPAALEALVEVGYKIRFTEGFSLNIGAGGGLYFSGSFAPAWRFRLSPGWVF